MDFMIVTLIIGIFVALIIGYYFGRKIVASEYRARFEEWILQKESEIREDAVRRSRMVLGGKFSEQLAPYLPDFKYDPTDARFVGTPIDMLVFKGLAANAPEEIIMLEIKSGEAGLSQQEKQIKELVENKKVRWELYRVPSDLTRPRPNRR